tara:strand:- start:19662 stop:20150 length:489 start_codon:yes stop_codon:yes gene_type:complete
MMKILNFTLKSIRELIQVAVWLLALAMLCFLAISILTHETEAKFSMVVSCDKACYDDLDLAPKVDYQEGLKVNLERDYIQCTYLSLWGFKYDNIWQSDWIVTDKSSEYLDAMVAGSWPVDDDFDDGRSPVREKYYQGEFGCRAHHPDIKPLEDRVYPDGKPY